MKNKHITFIIGGSYQGKKEYFLENYSDNLYCEIIEFNRWINNCDNVEKLAELIKTCGNTLCFDNAQEFVKWTCEKEYDVIEAWEEITKDIDDIYIIMNEIGNGIVPVDKFERKYREQTGRFGCYIAERAETVVRVFCGIGTVIKG